MNFFIYCFCVCLSMCIWSAKFFQKILLPPGIGGFSAEYVIKCIIFCMYRQRCVLFARQAFLYSVSQNCKISSKISMLSRSVGVLRSSSFVKVRGGTVRAWVKKFAKEDVSCTTDKDWNARIVHRERTVARIFSGRSVKKIKW